MYEVLAIVRWTLVMTALVFLLNNYIMIKTTDIAKANKKNNKISSKQLKLKV